VKGTDNNDHILVSTFGKYWMKLGASTILFSHHGYYSLQFKILSNLQLQLCTSLRNYHMDFESLANMHDYIGPGTQRDRKTQALHSYWKSI
jgi:hypothetical protein